MTFDTAIRNHRSCRFCCSYSRPAKRKTVGGLGLPGDGLGLPGFAFAAVFGRHVGEQTYSEMERSLHAASGCSTKRLRSTDRKEFECVTYHCFVFCGGTAVTAITKGRLVSNRDRNAPYRNSKAARGLRNGDSGRPAGCCLMGR